MTQYDTTCREAQPIPSVARRAPAAPDRTLDLDRVVWDPEYRDEVRAFLKGET